MEVFPIKDERKIETLKKVLSENPRNLLIFTIGVNSGLRMGDLLKLKVEQVRGLSIGDKVSIIEEKTGKSNYFIINQEIYKVLGLYFSSLDTIKGDEWLFPSRKGNDHLSVVGVNHMIKIWCQDVGIKENMGCHSLRKTFGYFMYKKYGVPLEVLMKRFCHSSQSITLRYIGIDEPLVRECLMNNI